MSLTEEQYIKDRMVERLNALNSADPLLMRSLMNTLHLTTFKTAVTHTLCHQINNSVATDFMGILNGLVGENKFVIKPIYHENQLVGFTNEPQQPGNLLTVNTDSKQDSLESK